MTPGIAAIWGALCRAVDAEQAARRASTLTRADAEWMGLCADCDELAVEGTDLCPDCTPPAPPTCARCLRESDTVHKVLVHAMTRESPAEYTELCDGCDPATADRGERDDSDRYGPDDWRAP